MKVKLEQVYTAYGKLAAEMIRAFLESNGIEATIIQESAGGTYGLTVGTLGEVQVYVNEEVADEAREILAAMERGEYEQADVSDQNEPADDETEPRDEEG